MLYQPISFRLLRCRLFGRQAKGLKVRLCQLIKVLRGQLPVYVLPYGYPSQFCYTSACQFPMRRQAIVETTFSLLVTV